MSPLAAEFTAPSISYSAIAPILVVTLAAVAGVLVEAFAPRLLRWPTQLAVSLAGLIGGFIAVCVLAHTREITAAGAIAVDGPTLFLQGTIAVIGVASVLLIADRSPEIGGGAFAAQAAAVPGSPDERAGIAAGRSQSEVFPLLMFAVSGMMLFPAANDLLMLFVALEVLSLPLYLMCGLARRRRLLSQEAAVKYFLLGAFSSAFFLYGLALLYGYAGTVSLGGIHDAAVVGAHGDTLLFLGLGLLGVGLLFKVGAAPFHSWIPDVYQGAPTPVTALMAAATKVAAFGALLRVFYVAFGGLGWDWRPIAWAVAILTMVVGSLLAVTQTDVKRMLAYSSIAHAGFLLIGVIALNRSGISGSLFYLLTYGLTTVGAFGILAFVRDPDGEATHLSRWAGLGRRSPVVAGVFTLFLLALAGIPLTSGFTGKFAVFSAGINGGATPLVVVAAVSSAVAAFFYVRVIVMMFFAEPAADGPVVVTPGLASATALAVAAAVTVVLGVFPQPVLDLASNAVPFLR
ncbi:MAG TPA: NADH-quinone oxidoreductase subunit NuoN [Mycobacteriales bacterium]|nr:NADH-quinone oxidoreductase subunit NuoN [Mycobacteriales bacterium]